MSFCSPTDFSFAGTTSRQALPYITCVNVIWQNNLWLSYVWSLWIAFLLPLLLALLPWFWFWVFFFCCYFHFVYIEIAPRKPHFVFIINFFLLLPIFLSPRFCSCTHRTLNFIALSVFLFFNHQYLTVMVLGTKDTWTSGHLFVLLSTICHITFILLLLKSVCLKHRRCEFPHVSSLLSGGECSKSYSSVSKNTVSSNSSHSQLVHFKADFHLKQGGT